MCIGTTTGHILLREIGMDDNFVNIKLQDVIAHSCLKFDSVLTKVLLQL